MRRKNWNRRWNVVGICGIWFSVFQDIRSINKKAPSSQTSNSMQTEYRLHASKYTKWTETISMVHFVPYVYCLNSTSIKVWVNHEHQLVINYEQCLRNWMNLPVHTMIVFNILHDRMCINLKPETVHLHGNSLPPHRASSIASPNKKGHAGHS